jgi:iron(III) transport system permease protein
MSGQTSFGAARLAALPIWMKSMLAKPTQAVMFAAGAALLVAIVLYPMALLVKFGFTTTAGVPTIQPLIDAFAQPGIMKAMLNSGELGIWVTAGCLLLGLPTAWLVARTDLLGKLILRLAATLTFAVPSFVTVIAWMFLASPNTGVLNILLRAVFGPATPPFDIMSFSGLVFVEIVHLYPLVFFTVSAALSTIDPSHEQAARLLGAGRVRIALTITLPLVLPAIVSGAILCLLDALSSYGAPAAIGTMANFSVLTTKIYDLLNYPPQLNLAAAVSMPIVVVTLLCLAVQKRLTGTANYRTLTGKGGKAQPVALKHLQWPAQLFCLAVVLVTAVLPIAALLILAFLKAFGTPVTFANLTTKNFAAVLDPSFSVLSAMENSLGLAMAAALLCIVLGVLFAWFVERAAAPGRGMATTIIMVAYGFPAIAFAVGVMLGYISILYGTFLIVLIAYVAKKLPISFVLARAAIKQMAPEFEEAARVAGAGSLCVLWQITTPLLKPSLWAAGMLVFSLSLRELTMSAILTQPSTQVMSVTVMQFIDNGTVELAAAVSVIIVALSLLGLVISKTIAGRGTLEVE